MLEYPSVLPLDCSKRLFEIISQRALAERKEEFAHCFWNVQGYVQGLLLGKGPAHEANLFGSGTKTIRSRRDAAQNDDELREIGEGLLKLQDQLVNDPPQFGANRGEGAFNWALILQMIPVVIQMLKELGVLKTEGMSVPGMIGAAPGDFPEEEESGSSSKSRETSGHNGVLTRECSVDELEVSDHIKKSLKEAGLKTVGQALDYQSKEEKGLQSVKGIGEASETEFNEAVKSVQK